MKKLKLRLSVISAVLTMVCLLSLPRIPLKIDSSFLQLDSYIGGYQFSLAKGRYSFDTTSFNTGIALSGGNRLILRPDLDEVEIKDLSTVHDDVKKVIETRISSLGAADTRVYINRHSEESEIIVEYPAIYSGAGFAGLVSQKGNLAFKTLREDLEWNEENYIQHVYNPEAWVDTEVTGDDLLGVDHIPGDSAQIRLRFSDVGRAKFSYVAKNNINRPVALYVDDSPFPISLPVVSEELAEGLVGDPILGGNFDNVTSKRLSVQLGAGALPVDVEIVAEEPIAPLISIRNDGVLFFGLLIGLLVVFVYFLIRYKKLGLLAIIGLLSYLLVLNSMSRLFNLIVTAPVLFVYILSIFVTIDFLLTICDFLVLEYSKDRPRNLFIIESTKHVINSYKGFFIVLLSTIFLFYILDEKDLGSSLVFVYVSGVFSYFTFRTFIEIFSWEKPMYERKRK